MTAYWVLTRDCPSLTPDFREELLSAWEITPREAVLVNALIRAWQEEPNNRQSPRDRQRELAARVVSMLKAGRCCQLCRRPTYSDDRLPVKNGTVLGVAHFECVGKLQNAMGFQQANLMRSRGLGVMAGGKGLPS